MLFIVPAKLADVAMSFWPDDNSSSYQDPNWCDQPHAYRLLGDSWHCIAIPEMRWGYYLARNGVGMQLLAARAWLLKHGPLGCSRNWTTSYDCSGPRATTRAERADLERRAQLMDDQEHASTKGELKKSKKPNRSRLTHKHKQEQAQDCEEDDTTTGIVKENEQPAALASSGSTRQAAAVCLSGQVRTILDVYETIRVRLVDPFKPIGGARVFMHVSLTSEYPPAHPGLYENSRWTMTKQQLQPARHGLGVRAADLTIYEEGTAYDHDTAKLKPSACYKDPTGPECSAHNGGAECHGPQFWGVSKCFAQILQAEREQGSPFQFTIRARPDSVPAPGIIDVILAAMSSDLTSPSWVRMASGVQSDGLLLAQGSEATQAVASIFDEFDGACLDPDQEKEKQLCDPFNVIWIGTECLLVRHIYAVMGKPPTIDDRLKGGFMRPVNSGDPSILAPCAPRCGL